jgi:hypothetical protein
MARAALQRFLLDLKIDTRRAAPSGSKSETISPATFNA